MSEDKVYDYTIDQLHTENAKLVAANKAHMQVADQCQQEVNRIGAQYEARIKELEAKLERKGNALIEEVASTANARDRIKELEADLNFVKAIYDASEKEVKQLEARIKELEFHIGEQTIHWSGRVQALERRLAAAENPNA
jgi:chromosome segregation ATPase